MLLCYSAAENESSPIEFKDCGYLLMPNKELATHPHYLSFSEDAATRILSSEEIAKDCL